MNEKGIRNLALLAVFMTQHFSPVLSPRSSNPKDEIFQTCWFDKGEIKEIKDIASVDFTDYSWGTSEINDIKDPEILAKFVGIQGTNIYSASPAPHLLMPQNSERTNVLFHLKLSSGADRYLEFYESPDDPENYFVLILPTLQGGMTDEHEDHIHLCGAYKIPKGPIQEAQGILRAQLGLMPEGGKTLDYEPDPNDTTPIAYIEFNSVADPSYGGKLVDMETQVNLPLDRGDFKYLDYNFGTPYTTRYRKLLVYDRTMKHHPKFIAIGHVSDDGRVSLTNSDFEVLNRFASSVAKATKASS